MKDTVSFQETTDSYTEGLQKAIDDLKSRYDMQKFRGLLDKIHEKFPVIDLVEFVEMHVSGEYTKEMIKRFNLTGDTDRKSVLKILKISPKRKSTQKGPKSKEINLTDPKLAQRYAYLKKRLNALRKPMHDKVTHNTLRMIITFQLYKKGDEFSSSNDLVRVITNTVDQFGHIMPDHCKELLRLNRNILDKMTRSILREMADESLLEANKSGKYRLEHHQLRLPHYVVNVIHNNPGITHEMLAGAIRENLPITLHLPQITLLKALDELVSDYKIIRKEGYWKNRPYFDQYFIFGDYMKMTAKRPSVEKGRFFGRKISPDKFIDEIIDLERGDFEDQDDQVTRIAGMILSRSNTMKHPPNDLEEFDFAIDLSEYDLVKNKQEIIQTVGLVISSDTVYVKVMIGKKITTKTLKDMGAALRDRERGEQGLAISFSLMSKSVKSLLERDKTIQVITREDLKRWCEITPVIPTRRGAVAVVRRGDHKGSIVKVESVNYESGLTNIVLFPDMSIGTQYIGSLEEIAINQGPERFADYSGKYFRFLGKLRKISKTDKFRTIVADGLSSVTDNAKTPMIDLASGVVKGDFGRRACTLMHIFSNPDTQSLEYSTERLFSCTCSRWKNLGRTEGLCPHMIFVLNETVKKILSTDGGTSDAKTEMILSKIEEKMDVFFDLLKYSTDRPGDVKCPHCGTTASTMDEVKTKFGYRQMDPNKKFSLRRQSRCKKCR